MSPTPVILPSLSVSPIVALRLLATEIESMPGEALPNPEFQELPDETITYALTLSVFVARTSFQLVDVLMDELKRRGHDVSTFRIVEDNVRATEARASEA